VDKNIRPAIVLFFVLSFWMSCLSIAEEKKEPEQALNDFSLVEYKNTSEKDWKVNGKTADLKEDEIKINDVSLVAFGEAGTPELKLKAGTGDFNKNNQMVHLENNVVAKMTDGTVLKSDSLYWDTRTRNIFTEDDIIVRKTDLFDVTGKGAVCNLEDKVAKVKKDVTATITASTPAYIENKNPILSNKNGKRTATIITCDGPLELNYKKNKASFLNNVKVEDIEGNIFADRIDVYYNPTTRRVRCVVARGNVRIVNGENVTYSDKAIYLVDEGKVILPKRPRLVIQNN